MLNMVCHAKGHVQLHNAAELGHDVSFASHMGAIMCQQLQAATP